jgi:hypothetical protein
MKKTEKKTGRPINKNTADTVANLSRRQFMTKSALLRVTAGVAGLGLNPKAASAGEGVGKLKRAGAAGFQPLEVNSPMAKWKKPQSLDWVKGARASTI